MVSFVGLMVSVGEYSMERLSGQSELALALWACPWLVIDQYRAALGTKGPGHDGRERPIRQIAIWRKNRTKFVAYPEKFVKLFSMGPWDERFHRTRNVS